MSTVVPVGTRLCEPGAIADPALRVLARRAHGGDRAADEHVAVGIEGGGLAVSMSAGMALALEHLGLMAHADSVYGTSAGALVAAYAAAGRMDDAAVILPATCTRDFISPAHPLRGRPVVSLDHLMGLVRARPPRRSAPDPRQGPDLRILVTRVHDGTLRTLRGFPDVEGVLAAVRAGMAIPFFAGAAVDYQGELVSDGGLIESIPAGTPLAEGATHVIALRSRDTGYRKGARGRLYGIAEDLVIGRLPGMLADLIRDRPGRYDAEAEDLAAAARGAGPLAGRATQLAPEPGTPLVGRLQVDRAKVLAAMAAGAQVVLDALTERA